MITICPKCALTLAVTAADLRVAQGYVRCGRCSSVFNALARLTDERQSPIPPPPGTVPPPRAATRPADTLAEPESVSEEALEFNPQKTDAASVFVQPKPDPQWAAATGTFKAMVAANQEPVLELEPEAPLEVEVDASFLATIIRSEPDATSVPPAAEALAADVDLEPRAAPAPAPKLTPEPARRGDLDAGADADSSDTDSSDADSADADSAGTAGAVRARAWLARHGWGLGAALAVLVLALQIINHNRDSLAASPRFNAPLTALYRALGVTLIPHWDLHAYDVRQLGASTDTQHTGQITVRASIKNTGQQAQPLPLLRVTLQDRFGNRIAARDVQPEFYLPGAVPPSALLGAGERIDAEMAFVDPGASAVGFELDACLPLRGGRVACANDSASR